MAFHGMLQVIGAEYFCALSEPLASVWRRYGELRSGTFVTVARSLSERADLARAGLMKVPKEAPAAAGMEQFGPMPFARPSAKRRPGGAEAGLCS